MRRALPVLALGIVAAILALGRPQVAGSEERESPHGAAEGCVACHEGTNTDVGAVKPIIPTCLGCHPDADMHPVGMLPRDVAIAEGFPLADDGTMTCATCHGEPAHRGDLGDPPWFRGGPHASTTAFCNTCHEPQALARVNPHHVHGRLGARESSCSACHTGRVAPGSPPDEAALRLDPQAVCATCHTGSIHFGLSQHVGQPAEASWGLPLADGRIACFTCHDVHSETAVGELGGTFSQALHQRALQTGDWAHLTQAELPGAPRERSSMLRLPLEGDRLCGACHGEGP